MWVIQDHMIHDISNVIMWVVNNLTQSLVIPGSLIHLVDTIVLFEFYYPPNWSQFIAYYFAMKMFRCFRLYLHSWKKFYGYQLLQALIVFMCKVLPEYFCSCELICKKAWNFFTVNNKQCMVCVTLIAYYSAIVNDQWVWSEVASWFIMSFLCA